MRMNVVHWRTIQNKEKLKYSDKNLPMSLLPPQNPTRTRLGSGNAISGVRGGRLTAWALAPSRHETRVNLFRRNIFVRMVIKTFGYWIGILLTNRWFKYTYHTHISMTMYPHKVHEHTSLFAPVKTRFNFRENAASYQLLNYWRLLIRSGTPLEGSSKAKKHQK
jgi:hypothetical protein